MKIYYPKSRNMAHALSLSIFIALKGTNFYIMLLLCYNCNWRCATFILLFCYYCSRCCVGVVAGVKVSPYIIRSADSILLLVL